MLPLKQSLLAIAVSLLVFSSFASAEGASPQPASTTTGSVSKPQAPTTASEEEYVDFQSEETFLDIADALKSKQYVRRAILSTVIRDTSTMRKGSYYVNHLMGFSAILQRAGAYSKYVSGMQGISAGYVAENGHSGELGVELSTVANIYGGYRYFYRPPDFTLWLSAGAGLGMEVGALSLGGGPVETLSYNGSKQMFFGILGLMIPLVDVAFKAEVRFNFYSFDRLVLSQGVGVTIFL